MALDKNELKYLITELKKYFVVRTDIGNIGGSGVTEEDLNELRNDIENLVDNKNFATKDHVNEQIQEVEDMFGGKALRYVTQAEYDVLSEEDKNNDNIVWNITDKEDLSHTHDNMDILSGITQENIDAWNNSQVVLPDNIVTEDKLNEVRDMFGGKALRYITQAEYNNLSEEDKNNPNIAWVITDAVDLSHSHDNMDILGSITQERMESWDNGANIEIPDNIVTEDKLNEVRDMFGGKALRYITQAEYNNLSEEDKNNPNIAWVITDKEELPDNVVTEDDLQHIIDDVELLKNVVEKPPTYIMPSLSMNVYPSDIPLHEDNEIRITFKFNKNDAGNINNVILKRNGIVISENVILNEFLDNVNVSDANPIVYSLSIMYNDGPVKNSNLGTPYPNNAIKASTITVEKTVSVFAPSYYGSVKTFDVSLLNVINNASKECTFTSIYLDDEKFVYMYPSNFGELNSIKDGNNFEYINSYTKDHIQYNGIDYLVYILTDSVTISDFKQIFS